MPNKALWKTQIIFGTEICTAQLQFSGGVKKEKNLKRIGNLPHGENFLLQITAFSFNLVVNFFEGEMFNEFT